MQTRLKIRSWPEKILKRRSQEVKEVDLVIRNILDQMYIVMKSSDGLGLASNQVGLDMQLIVVEVEGQVFKLANPKITKREGAISFKEGCLSFPGIELSIKRSRKVRVEALDQEGKPFDVETEGLLAIVFQHEIDHVNGINFIDRISFWRRVRVMPRLKKLKKRGFDGVSK